MTQHLRTHRPRLSALTVAFAALLSITACSAGTSSASRSAQDGGAPTTLTQGVLTVGIAEFPPFVGIDGEQITGVDGAIITEIAARLGLTIKAVPLEFSALTPALNANRVDAVIGSVFRTAERAKVIAYTDPLYLEPGSLISTAADVTIDDFTTQRVGTVQGYNWVDDVQKILGDRELAQYPSTTELKADLEAGRIDIALDSYGTALHHYAGTGFTVTPFPADKRIKAAIQPGQTAILLNKSNTVLLSRFNTEIAELHSSGFIAKELPKSGLDPESEKTGRPRLL